MGGCRAGPGKGSPNLVGREREKTGTGRIGAVAREPLGGEKLTKENSNDAHGWQKAVKKKAALGLELQ